MAGAPGQRLGELARADATVAPLALLHVEVLRASADRHWHEAVPSLEAERLQRGAPLLHETTLTVAPERVEHWLLRLAALAVQHGQPAADALGTALRRQLLHPLELLQASIEQDTARLEALAASSHVEMGVLATLAGLASLPLLRACGDRAQALLGPTSWGAGICPVCAAWPALAELRGLERERWLRCGRCAAGWRFSHVHCPFCARAHEGREQYLAPADARDARRAVTCSACRGYLKTLTTLGPLSAEELVVQDLATVELDVVALEREFLRPTEPGFPLRLILQAPTRRNGWWRWRR
ncbi:MAG TPA: formate dehydrogenase accessory protein FdhE [Chloroflexota bacterium]|nr:formate dehydrogenase accessory protein FdhE [Chloroflexota bacterium]